MNKNKRYSLVLLGFLSICLIVSAGLTIYLDPYFHYHMPNKKFIYNVNVSNKERYQNDGIMRNYEYDAMIVGTSMTKNFKTSVFDELFNVNSIKVSFAGATYKEVNDNINRAIEYNPNLKYVLRALDCEFIYQKADAMMYEESYYPTYLTNDNIFDDVYYLFNKSIFLNNIPSLLKNYDSGNDFSIDFDELYNFMQSKSYFFNNWEMMLSKYKRPEKIEEKVIPDEMEIVEFQKNIDTNIVQTVKDNPNIEFYYFITPYSILWWDKLSQENTMEKWIQGERMIIESLIEYNNVHLFSFSQEFYITTDLDIYGDIRHYNEDINSYMLEKMARDENRLTKDNYEDYLKDIYDFYSNYDYDSIFE